jgi:hypothetical protein
MDNQNYIPVSVDPAAIPIAGHEPRSRMLSTGSMSPSTTNSVDPLDEGWLQQSENEKIAVQALLSLKHIVLQESGGSTVKLEQEQQQQHCGSPLAAEPEIQQVVI